LIQKDNNANEIIKKPKEKHLDISMVIHPNMSAENVYCLQNANKTKICNEVIDLSFINSQNLSSFSSEHYQDSRANQKIQPKGIGDLTDVDVRQVEEIYLPFLEKDDQFIQTNFADKSDKSTVFRSSKHSKALSPFTTQKGTFL
jgi:hypothetical protein